MSASINTSALRNRTENSKASQDAPGPVTSSGATGLSLFPLPSSEAFRFSPTPHTSAEQPTRPTEAAKDLKLTWEDGSPVMDCEELDPSLIDPRPVEDFDPEDLSTLQLETTGITRQAFKGKMVPGELWKQASTFKLSIAAKLREVGMTEEAHTLEDCHSHRVFMQCNGCHGVRVFRNRCDNFFCPECQPSLSKKRAGGVSWWTTQIQQPKHVVLTVRNIPDITKGHVLELKKWFTRLRHRQFCKNWKGGFYSIECTNEGKGWHLHIHVLVDARYVDARQLSLEWNAATNGAGNIVKVKDCRDHHYLAEVTKYAAKGSQLAGWTPSELRDFILSFRDTRTFGVFGSLYGKRTEFRAWLDSIKDSKPKCECGCNEVRYYDEHEWLARDCVAASVSQPRAPGQTAQVDFLGKIGANGIIRHAVAGGL